MSVNISRFLTLSLAICMGYAVTAHSNPSGPVYGTGGGPGGGVSTVTGTANEVGTSGTSNVIVTLTPTLGAPASCQNCDLDIDENGRITAQSNGTGGSGATTDTSGVVHPTNTSGNFAETWSVGGDTSAAPLHFDGTDLNLTSPGAGIIMAPHTVAGSALVLDEASNSTGGHSFTLKVPDFNAGLPNNGGLTADVVCELEPDGALPVGCPLLNNAGGGSTTVTGLTDTTITSPTNNQVLTFDSGGSAWINAAVPTAAHVHEIDTTAGQVVFNGPPTTNTALVNTVGTYNGVQADFAASTSTNWAKFWVRNDPTGFPSGNWIGNNTALNLELAEIGSGFNMPEFELLVNGTAPPPSNTTGHVQICTGAGQSAAANNCMGIGDTTIPGSSITELFNFNPAGISNMPEYTVEGGFTWDHAFHNTFKDKCGAVIFYDWGGINGSNPGVSFPIIGGFYFSNRTNYTTGWPEVTAANADGYASNDGNELLGFRYPQSVLRAATASGLGNLDTSTSGVFGVFPTEQITIAPVFPYVELDVATPADSYDHVGQFQIPSSYTNGNANFRVTPYSDNRGSNSLMTGATAQIDGAIGAPSDAGCQPAAFRWQGQLRWAARTWQPSTAYGSGGLSCPQQVAGVTSGCQVVNGDNVYSLTTASEAAGGTSAGSGGPTCTSGTCADNNLTWLFRYKNSERPRSYIKIIQEP